MAVKRLDINDFYDKDVTKYDSMYKILEEFLPELNGDFSTHNLLLNIKNSNVEESIKKFSNIFLRVSNAILQAVGEEKKPDGDIGELFEVDKSAEKQKNPVIVCRNFTENEKAELLQALREKTRGIDDCEKFTTITEYVNYIRNHMENEKLAGAIDAIYASAKDIFTDRESKEIKRTLLLCMYVPQAIQRATEEKATEKDVTKKDENDYSKLEILKFFKIFLENSNKFSEYEDFIEESKINLRKQKISDFTHRIRKQYFTNEVLRNMTLGERTEYDRKGLSEVLFGRRQFINSEPVKTGFWEIEEYPKPQVIMDTLANYSEQYQVATQRVIAVSYGKFKYTIDNVSNNLIQPDFIGITRIGKDGIHTYFGLAVLDRISFKSADEIEKTDSKYNLNLNGNEAVVTDYDTGKIVFPVMNQGKIPRNLEEFYAKVFFSDEYMKKATDENYRYMGYVTEVPTKGKTKTPRINGYDIDTQDQRAAKHATGSAGKVGTRIVRNLAEYCNSTALREKQIRIVQTVSNRFTPHVQKAGGEKNNPSAHEEFGEE